MKTTLLLSLLIFSNFNSYAQEFEYVEIYDKHNKFGLYKTNSTTFETEFVLDTVYKNIEEVSYDMFIVQNMDSKYGIVNASGQTVVPFNLDDIEVWEGEGFDYSAYELLSGGAYGLKLYKDGKVGYMDFRVNKMLPIEYDNIEQFYGVDSFIGGYIVRQDKKYALFSPDLDAHTPCEYDAVFQSFYQNQMFYNFIKNGKCQVIKSDVIGKELIEKLKTSANYDYVIDSVGIIKSGETYEIYNCFSGKLLQKTANLPDFKNEEEETYFAQNGKYGMKDYKGKIILKPKFFIIPNAYYADILVYYDKKMEYYRTKNAQKISYFKL